MQNLQINEIFQKVLTWILEQLNSLMYFVPYILTSFQHNWPCLSMLILLSVIYFRKKLRKHKLVVARFYLSLLLKQVNYCPECCLQILFHVPGTSFLCDVSTYYKIQARYIFHLDTTSHRVVPLENVKKIIYIITKYLVFDNFLSYFWSNSFLWLLIWLKTVYLRLPQCYITFN